MALEQHDHGLRAEDGGDRVARSHLTGFAAWVVRPVVLFAASYTVVGVLHEVAHALTAYVLGVPGTLFHLYVHLDAGDGTLDQRAVIRAAGPVFCLGFGMAAWAAHRRAFGSPWGLPLLYVAWFGVGTFFGNLMGTPFVGDFSSMALAFEMPMPARYAIAAVGLVSICGLSYYLGTELRRWTPVASGRVAAMFGMIVVPAIIGTAIVLLIFQPMPADWIASRLGESAFWIFAAVGTLVSRKSAIESSGLAVRWPEVAALFAAALVVRLIAGGIGFGR